MECFGVCCRGKQLEMGCLCRPQIPGGIMPRPSQFNHNYTFSSHIHLLVDAVLKLCCHSLHCKQPHQKFRTRLLFTLVCLSVLVECQHCCKEMECFRAFSELSFPSMLREQLLDYMTWTEKQRSRLGASSCSTNKTVDGANKCNHVQSSCSLYNQASIAFGYEIKGSYFVAPGKAATKLLETYPRSVLIKVASPWKTSMLMQPF